MADDGRQKAIRELLIKSLLVATGASEINVREAPLTTAIEHAKRCEALRAALSTALAYCDNSIHQTMQYHDEREALYQPLQSSPLPLKVQP